MRHRRHEGVGQSVGGDHREDDRHRQRTEEIAGDAAEREQRREGDADAKQRDRRRRHDFLGAPGDGGQDILAVLLHVPVDVLDGDGRVVDQDADRERETAERHHVDRLPEQRQRDQGTENRQRYRHGDDERRAPAAEKDEDHERGQRRGDQPFANDGGNRGFHEIGLVADEGERDSGRERGLNRRKPVLDAGDDVEGRGGADLEDRHQHALASVELDDVGLRRRSVVDVGNVAHEDDGAVDHLDRHVVEVGDRLGRIVEVEGEFVGADLLRPDRRDLVLPGERIADIIRGKTVGVQRLLIQIDLNLARRAAIGERKLRPRDGGELGADEVLGEVEQLDLGERVARQRELDDRDARGVIDQDDRRRRALRKLLEDGLRYRGHLRLRSIDVHVRLEVDLDDADARQRLRLDVLDIVDGCGQHALVRGDDPTRHVVRREAGVAPDDRDDRNADIGKNVGRGPDRRERAEDHHQDRHNDEGVRTRES